MPLKNSAFASQKHWIPIIREKQNHEKITNRSINQVALKNKYDESQKFGSIIVFGGVIGFWLF